MLNVYDMKKARINSYYKMSLVAELTGAKAI